MENAYFSGFYDEMIGFLRTLFESSLKTNPYLEFAVMTGCLRISKESIFTGMNNLEIISILSDEYTEHFGFTEDEVKQMLQFYGREDKFEITYDDIYESEDNLWNFLFFTGYLKKVSLRFSGRQIYATMSIPNDEVCYIYQNTVLAWFDRCIRQKDFRRLCHAIVEKDIPVFEEEISRNLMETISFYDYQENYYHGFMTGLLKTFKDYIIESNREKGLGRPDLIMRNAPYQGLGIIFDLKISDSIDKMQETAELALAQIEKQNYEDGLCKEGYRTIIKYGIAFFKKSCKISVR